MSLPALPAAVRETVIVWVPAFRPFFVVVFRPVPVILTVPAAPSRVLALIAVFEIEAAGGQPVTATGLLRWISRPFWALMNVGTTSFCPQKS